MVGSLFAQYLPDLSEMSETEKMLVFENNEKHPAFGVIFSIFLPSSGHAYAGNWKRGLIFTGAKFVAIISGVSLPDKCERDPLSIYLPPICGPNPTSNVLFGLAVVLNYWEVIDAGKEVTRYNDKLYKHIFGKEPPSISLNLQPTYDGANLSMTYSFK